MTDIANPLGEVTAYPEAYSPELLFAVPRHTCRSSLGIQSDALPFSGMDVWTAYELSWLDLKGKPQVRMGELTVAADSLNLAESKSLKLYLNSLNQERFGSDQAVIDRITADIEQCVQGAVSVALWKLDQQPEIDGRLTGSCIDELDVSCETNHPDSSLLRCVKSVASADSENTISEALYSHLLKTNCPVTGQPDWATVWISYTGQLHIEQESLLQYLVSYRCHQDYHENCVERIYMDLMAACKPAELQVYARYTRRGGLDINPYRSSESGTIPPRVRLSRQ